MKTEELKAHGLTEEQIAFVMAENGKDLSKLQKANDTLTTDCDNWKQKAETAEDTLKNFEGIDPANIQKEIDGWKQKAADAEKNAQAQIYERDFADALKSEFEQYKFSSEAAKRDVMSQVKEAGLKLKDGKILGLSDMINLIKEKDASAFVDDSQARAQQNQARFTTQFGANHTPGNVTKESFKAMSLDEKMKLKKENPEFYNALRK